MRNPTLLILVVLAILIGVLIGMVAADKSIAAGSPWKPDFVTRVIDGDTYVLEQLGTVRVIGVDTPETRGRNDQPCFTRGWGVRAREYADGLVGLRNVRYRFERDRRDRYGRWLVHLRVGRRGVGARLLMEGLAREESYSPNTARRSYYRRLQREAVGRGEGVWRSCRP